MITIWEEILKLGFVYSNEISTAEISTFLRHFISHTCHQKLGYKSLQQIWEKKCRKL